MKIAYYLGNTLQVFRYGKTANNKISNGERLVQSYTFSRFQLEYVREQDATGEKIDLKTFFSLDKENCLDCPFSGNSGDGGCYTHKYMQFSGFLSMLRSLKDIPTYTEDMHSQIVDMCRGNYVRFGTYGEPSLHPKKLVKEICKPGERWTGYTHQWRGLDYSDYFMASCHDADDTLEANEYGWRTFTTNDIGGVQCPASKEAGFKSNCATCGLCSGTTGKGRKNVQINLH